MKMINLSNERVADLIIKIYKYGHSAGYSADEVLSVLSELLAYREAAGKATAEIVSKFGDPESFGERELKSLTDIQKYPYGTKLYTAPPLPVVPQALLRELVDVVWQDAKESAEVPATNHADKLISQVFGNSEQVNSPAIPDGSEYRIADAIELLKLAAPHMLNDENLKDPSGAMCGKRRYIPDGFALVPIEPTREMIWAAKNALSETVGWESFKIAYQSMIAAAPKPKDD